MSTFVVSIDLDGNEHRTAINQANTICGGLVSPTVLLADVRQRCGSLF